MEEKPLRKHELEVIAILSGMIRQYNEISSNTPLDDVHMLICKTAYEILDVCDPKPSSDSVCSCGKQMSCYGSSMICECGEMRIVKQTV